MDSTLDYMDQASFLGLRALGHAPVIQFFWIYDEPPDSAQLNRFHTNLGRGLLGRLVETSPLPFGRHRWVRWAGSGIEESQDPIPRGQIGSWLDTQHSLVVDPEEGPGWRLLVQPLTDGGTAIVLLVAHTLADGLGACEAVADAVRGTDRRLGHPPPRSRTRWRAVRQDARTTMRSLPDTAKAAAAAVRLGRAERAAPAASGRPARTPRRLAGPGVQIPSVLVTADAQLWTARARALNGSDSTLLAALAALIGQQAGRVGPDGSVQLAVPVSVRRRGDTRGNALSGITVNVDPVAATTDLRPLRTQMGTALAELSRDGNDLLAPMALTPFIPLRLARRLEGLALGPGQPVGHSTLGAIDPDVNRPAGRDADAMWVRRLEALSRDDLDRLGGTLGVVSLTVGGSVRVSVSGWQPGRVESRADLAACVAAAADRLGIEYGIEPGTD